MSSGTSCVADNIGYTLGGLMRSLASMTGNLMGGDTLAGGGAAAARDRVHGLPSRATGARVTASVKIFAVTHLCQPRARHGDAFWLQVIVIYAEKTLHTIGNNNPSEGGA